MGKAQRKLTTNKDIVQLLRSIVAAYLIENKNRFRIMAYEKAADAVEKLGRELRDIWEEGKIEEVPGIGKTLAVHLNELFTKGSSSHFERALSNIPPSVFEMMKIPTLGPKKAYVLATTFNIRKGSVVKDLKKIAKQGKIAELDQFGEKSQAAILNAIAAYEKNVNQPERILLPSAYQVAQDMVEYLRRSGWIKRIDILGSLRRMLPTIGDVDLAVVVDAKHVEDIIHYFTKYPKTLRIEGAGDKKASILVFPYVKIDLRVQEEESFGSMLQYFTGSKTHNIKLREYAIKKGYSLSEHGIKQISTKKLLKFKNEEDFYGFLGLDYIPPQIREGTNEIDLALKHKLPKLVELKDVKGDLHVHSNYDLKPSHDSGQNSYSELCKKAKELKYSYIGFTDHNPRQKGHDDNEITLILKKRKEHMRKTLAKHQTGSFQYFIGLEVDILPSGKLAIPDSAIEHLDYMVVSVHSAFTMHYKEMTARVLQALAQPKVKIFGHPTARLIGKRDGIDLDWDKIFEFCSKKNIALEINSWPERLDLPDSLVKRALDLGCSFTIDTDAHEESQMENMRYGVAVSQRGWVQSKNVMNTLSLAEFKKWIMV